MAETHNPRECWCGIDHSLYERDEVRTREWLLSWTR